MLRNFSLQIKVVLVHTSFMKTAISGIACALLIVLSLPARSQELGKIPSFLGPNNVAAGAAIEPQQGVHFITTLDFPPFNFLDSTGRLTGFNVYLARQLCAELSHTANCTIQGMPWEEIESAMAREQGNAVIAGVAATERSREKYAFSKPYLRIPARFIALKTAAGKAAFGSGLEGMKIGTLAQSAFDATARSLFPAAAVIGYASDELLIDDLKSGTVDVIFGDGVRLAFFLSTESGSDCCSFVGGPYFAPAFLGEGMRIAFPLENERLKNQIDLALISLQRKGMIEDLYLRFFPIGFY